LTGLYHAAVYYYQKGLEFPVVIEGDKQVSLEVYYFTFQFNRVWASTITK